MKLSARNQIKGTVSNIKEGAVNGVVTIALDGQDIKCDITMEAIKDLGLAAGKEAYAIIKASNVLIAAGDAPLAGLSARNQFAGKVSKVDKGAVNGHVAIEVGNGITVCSSITNEAIDALGLEVGAAAVAIIKATDVMVAVD